MKKNRIKPNSPMKTRRLSKGSQMFSLNIRSKRKVGNRTKNPKTPEFKAPDPDNFAQSDDETPVSPEIQENPEIDTVDLNEDHFHPEFMPVNFDWIRIDPLIVQIQLPVKNRTQNEGLRTLNFRTSPRSLKISHEYYRSI